MIISPSLRSRQSLLLAGAFLLAIAARVYLSRGGAEAMVYRSPHLHSVSEVETLACFFAFAVAVSAAIAAAGKRWVGGIAAVVLAGIGGLLAISQYNAILGAGIGLNVGLLVACGVFIRVLATLARTFVALAAGVVCGAAALATQHDLSGGPGMVVLVLMGATVVVAALVLFRHRRTPPAAERKRRWVSRLGRASLLFVVIFGLWLSLSADTARRVRQLGQQGNLNPLTPELPWLWRGCVKVTFLRDLSDLNDSDLRNLGGFTDLEALDLRNSHITDAGTSQLDVLPRLNWLVLSNTEVTGSGLDSLAALPALTVLSLTDTRADDEGLKRIGKLAALRHLELNATRISDEGLKHLEGLTSLRALQLNNTQITGEGLKHLKGLTSLGELQLNKTQITGEGLSNLAPLVWLRTLDLSDTEITDAGLEKLPVLPRLTSIRLNGTQITDAGLQQLQKFPMLFLVDVHGTAVTAEGAEEFCKIMQRRMRMPECKVER